MKKGDRYRWNPQDCTCGAKHPDWFVYIKVTRAARDGSWADIVCYNWAAMWVKRQPLIDGQIPGAEPYAWTLRDLDDDAGYPELSAIEPKPLTKRQRHKLYRDQNRIIESKDRA